MVRSLTGWLSRSSLWQSALEWREDEKIIIKRWKVGSSYTSSEIHLKFYPRNMAAYLFRDEDGSYWIWVGHEPNEEDSWFEWPRSCFIWRRRRRRRNVVEENICRHRERNVDLFHTCRAIFLYPPLPSSLLGDIRTQPSVHIPVIVIRLP